MKKLIVLGALTLGSAITALAADPERPFKFVAGIGVTGGGDTLATVQFSNGDTHNIKAGGLLMLYVGGEARIGELVSVQATVGYHVDSTNADNGRVRFSRVPVDLLAYYPVTDQFRLGIGAQFVNDAKLKGTGVASNIDIKFDSTTGLVLEGEYLFTPRMGLKLRGVSEKFKQSGSSNSVSGNHVGLLFNVYF
jgi:hypothetical protein